MIILIAQRTWSCPLNLQHADKLMANSIPLSAHMIISKTDSRANHLATPSETKDSEADIINSRYHTLLSVTLYF